MTFLAVLLRGLVVAQGPFAEGEQAKIKVKARLNLHGLVTLENAQQLVEEDVEEAAPKAEDTPMQVSSAQGFELGYRISRVAMDVGKATLKAGAILEKSSH